MLITDKKEIQQYTDAHRVWQGIPGIVHTKGGRTFVSLYSGDVLETYGNFAVLLMSNDEKHFEHIAVVRKEGQYRIFDPVLWIDPLGRLWFIWNVMPGEQVMASICGDPDADVLQWGEPRQIGRGIMMNKPVVLSPVSGCSRLPFGSWIFTTNSASLNCVRMMWLALMCGRPLIVVRPSNGWVWPISASALLTSTWSTSRKMVY